MRGPRPPRPLTAGTTSRGFTIVEVLLVLVLLVVIGSVTVPRLVGVTRRQVQVALDGVQDLLSMFAYRDSLGAQPVAIWFDPATGTLQLMVKEAQPEDRQASAEWLPDRFVQPVRFPPGMEIVDVRFDDRPQSLNEWLFTTLPNTERPRLEIVLDSDEGAARFLLDPHAIAPIRFESGVDAPAYRSPRDLDGLGLDRGVW